MRSIILNPHDIVFVAKSIGTVVACRLKEEMNIKASLVLFTPIIDTLPFIKRENQIILVAASNNDRHLEGEILCNLCERENISYYIKPLGIPPMTYHSTIADRAGKA